MHTLGRRMLSSLGDNAGESSASLNRLDIIPCYTHDVVFSLFAASKDIHANLSTVALLPVSTAVPLARFAAKMCEALSHIGECHR